MIPIIHPPVRSLSNRFRTRGTRHESGNGWNLNVRVRKAGTPLWGSLISCGRLSIGLVALPPDSGGSQPPRRLPACPTSRQPFHSYVAHFRTCARLLCLFAASLAAASAQNPADFEKSVRAAMAPALAQQRASIRKQSAAARNTSATAGGSFFTTPFPIHEGLFTTCDPVPADELNTLIEGAAQKQGLDSELIRAVIEEESAARPCAISYQGAEGLMQLMPATAEQFEVQDPFDPKQNIEGGAKFLKLLLDKYDNDVSLALGAYNAGPARVDQEGGIPPIPETLNYVADILRKLHPQENKPQ